MHQQDLNSPLKTVISAVGRSGTTIIHNLLLEIYADLYGDDHDQLYEPFLWDSAALRDYPRIASQEKRFGDMDSISSEGVYCHTALPLFIDDATDISIPSNLPKYLLSDSKRPLIAKFIRANGRLPLLDQLYQKARFIVLIRNPLDVVNSVVTRFSFFGEENHKSDFPRFLEEIKSIFGIALPATALELPVAYKAALWCHFMNLFAVRHAQGKENYIIVAYENFRENKEVVVKDICAHIGVTYKNTYAEATLSTVGRTTGGQPKLTKSDVESIIPLFNEYWALASQVSTLTASTLNQILTRYADNNLPPSPPPERGFGWSPLRAEGHIIKLQAETFIQQAKTRNRLSEIQHSYLASPQLAKSDWRIPISVIVTSFNNATTLEQAVKSVCQQSYLPQEIIIADDCSTDQSRDIINTLTASNNLIKPIFRDSNIGVSANRNDAIKQCRNPFICQLDGDDAYSHTKLEREAYVLMGSQDHVAFSDTEYMGSKPTYWDCSWLTALSGNAATDGMVSRRSPLPRDMLMAKELFFAAEGYRENCSIYEDWAFKIRLTRVAKDWRYSGGTGTFYRPGGLSQSGTEKLMDAALWVLSSDVTDILHEANALPAVYEGLLNLLRKEYNHTLLQNAQTRDLIAAKIDSFLKEVNLDFIQNKENNAATQAIKKAELLVKTVELSIPQPLSVS